MIGYRSSAVHRNSYSTSAHSINILYAFRYSIRHPQYFMHYITVLVNCQKVAGLPVLKHTQIKGFSGDGPDGHITQKAGATADRPGFQRKFKRDRYREEIA